MQQKRTTPEFISELQPGEIFVFGSNLRGMHGGGAAYAAYRKFGAVMGFAKAHPELTFLVTRIGCGIAGFTDEEISPLFKKAHNIDNIVLPKGW